MDKFKETYISFDDFANLHYAKHFYEGFVVGLGYASIGTVGINPPNSNGYSHVGHIPQRDNRFTLLHEQVVDRSPEMFDLSMNGVTSDSEKTYTVLVDFIVTPKGMSQEDFMTALKAKLVANGVNPKVIVAKKTIGTAFEAWWNDDPVATLTIRSFSHGDVLSSKGGFAVLNSNKAVVYNELNTSGKPTNSPMWKYVNVAAHELGHAIWGFSHPLNGFTSCPECLMDYRGSSNNPGSMYNPEEQKNIRTSSWGRK
jgi:hypothetical protein